MGLLIFYGDKFNPKEMGISLIDPLYSFIPFFFIMLDNLFLYWITIKKFRII